MAICGFNRRGEPKGIGCGASILWIRTKRKGRMMPVDPELLAPDGEETLIFEDGYVGKRHPDNSRMRGYRSHWATCAKRAEFKHSYREKRRKGINESKTRVHKQASSMSQGRAR